MSSIIKSQAIVAFQNRNQFKAYINDIVARTHGAEIEFYSERIETKYKVTYTLTCDDNKIASEVHEAIQDGIYYHGG